MYKLDTWRLLNPEKYPQILCKRFEFKHYKDSVIFAYKVGLLLDKYKDEVIQISHSKEQLLVFINSSKEKAINENDYKIANEIDKLLSPHK